jgi:quinol monooxygenase YgiN
MEKSMILATIRMLISPEKRDDALKILKPIAERSGDDPGCLSCHIYEDLKEKDVFMFEEIWKSEADLERHMRSKEYLNLLLVVEMARKRPEIRFDTISNSTGIETIERARKHAV